MTLTIPLAAIYTLAMTALLCLVTGAGVAYGGFRLMAAGDHVGIGLGLIFVGAVIGLAGLLMNHQDHIRK